MDGIEIIHGIRIGRHDFCPEEVMSWIDRNVIAYGLNFLRFNVRGVEVDAHYFREWAHYLAENKICEGISMPRSSLYTVLQGGKEVYQ